MKYLLFTFLILITITSFSQNKFKVLGGDTIFYDLQNLNDFKFKYSEASKEFVDHPDEAYAISLTKPDNIEINCEVCQDGYYEYYALLNYQGEEHYELRKELREIYLYINSIEGSIVSGGTYFGHMWSRIFAYVEYDMYLYQYFIKYREYDPPISISAQKAKFLEFYKQSVNDRIKANNDFVLSEKEKKRKLLLAKINEIDKIIGEDIYLHKCFMRFLLRQYNF